MNYRLYIDESGNADLGSSIDPNHRYLSLTGVIIEFGHATSALFPSLEKLKSTHFDHTPESPVILHRKDIMNRRGCFACLKDPVKNELFCGDLLTLLENIEYTVITVVIDKLHHMQKYKVWQYEPYHYCMMVVIERYVHWLEACDGLGDVMAESRRGGHDRRLKDSFTRLLQRGTAYLPTASLNTRLTSRQIKMSPKANNIPGVQIADTIAHPSSCWVIDRKSGKTEYRPNFGGQIARILEASRYYRGPNGKIEGFGRKWLP